MSGNSNDVNAQCEGYALLSLLLKEIFRLQLVTHHKLLECKHPAYITQFIPAIVPIFTFFLSFLWKWNTGFCIQVLLSFITCFINSAHCVLRHCMCNLESACIRCTKLLWLWQKKSLMEHWMCSVVLWIQYVMVTMDTVIHGRHVVSQNASRWSATQHRV